MQLEAGRTYVQADGRTRRISRRTVRDGREIYVTDTGMEYLPSGHYRTDSTSSVFDLIMEAPQSAPAGESGPGRGPSQTSRFDGARFVRDILSTARQKGWTSAVLAERLSPGLGIQTVTMHAQISRWRHGGRTPRADTFLIVCSRLGLDPSRYLLGQP